MKVLKITSPIIAILILVCSFLPVNLVSAAVSLDLQVSASTDDTRVLWNGTAWTLNNAATPYAGWSSVTVAKTGAGIRFLNATIPVGATITAAYITLTANSAKTVTTVNTRITGDLEASSILPATFSNIANYQSRRGTVVGGANDTKITTAVVAWDSIGAWTNNVEYHSPDISAIIQEIINQGTWTSGYAIALFWDDHADRSSHNSGAIRQIYSYDDSTTKAPKLHIEYTVPVSITISNSASSYTLNSDNSGSGIVMPNTTYYSNPLGSTTSPTVGGVLDTECEWTLTNTSTAPIDVTCTMSDYSGGSSASTNSNAGTNGATSYGAKSYFSGQASGAWTVIKTSGSSIGYSNLAANTNIKWGFLELTRTNYGTGVTGSTAVLLITATAH